MNHAANLSNPVVQILPPVRILPLITSEGEDLICILSPLVPYQMS